MISRIFRMRAKSPRSLLAGVLLPVVILLMHGFGSLGDAAAQHAFVAGLAVLGAVSRSYLTHANGLVIARESGVLRRWQLNPLPPACFFTGKIITTVLAADASAVVTVLVASCMGVTASPLGVARPLNAQSLAVLAGWALLATVTALLHFPWAPRRAQ